MARGDHIFVQRLGGVYSHHGIDCGNGEVIHFAAPHWLAAREVRRTTLTEFARGQAVQVRDYAAFHATLRHPENLPRRLQLYLQDWLAELAGEGSRSGEVFEPDAVVRRAESRLRDRRFSLLLHNCEHFATWCKTGLVDSEQIHLLWQTALGVSEFRRLRDGR